MILRIILSISAIIVIISVITIVNTIIVPMCKMVHKTEEVFTLFQNFFNLYPEERQRLFSEYSPMAITCGSTKINSSSMEMACIEFEGIIDELLDYYEKYKVIVNVSSILQYNKQEISEIKERMKWIRKRI